MVDQAAEPLAEGEDQPSREQQRGGGADGAKPIGLQVWEQQSERAEPRPRRRQTKAGLIGKALTILVCVPASYRLNRTEVFWFFFPKKNRLRGGELTACALGG